MWLWCSRLLPGIVQWWKIMARDVVMWTTQQKALVWWDTSRINRNKDIYLRHELTLTIRWMDSFLRIHYCVWPSVVRWLKTNMFCIVSHYWIDFVVHACRMRVPFIECSNKKFGSSVVFDTNTEYNQHSKMLAYLKFHKIYRHRK